MNSTPATNPYDIPYFVRTLDYTEPSNELTQRTYEKGTIGCLIDNRAEDDSGFENSAVGMPVPGRPNMIWEVEVFSYKRLGAVVNTHAHRLVQNRVVHGLHDHTPLSSGNIPPVVALLSDSSLEMLINFLALVKIGYAVLLIAPQCTTEQITHLLAQSASRYILVSQNHKDSAFECFPCSCIPRLLPEIDMRSPPLAYQSPTTCSPLVYQTPNFVTESTIAYIHHSSGTTGMPKLILYPHSSAIGNRVYDNYYNFKATFTTTPLYHGGIADFMRLLMAYSTLWLYPSTMPITSKNMFKALSICQSPRAYYFSSVPYVLEVCAGDAATVHKLIGMDMVGVGGAPLEEDIGNFLVKKGVKLVSRFGTSECGFLMSSYRSFQVDQEWDYLRSKHGSAYEFISLGTRGFDGEQKFELEVLSTWPQMNCQPNTPRGRYATGDLFVRHPLVTEAYKHVGRRDTLIALSNGKKLDPTVIERALEESELALESFVFGNGRPFPGILVFPSTARNVSREEIFKVLGEKNAGTNIMPDMIVFPPPYLYPLRSSKGQIMRQTTLEIFKKDIEKAYKRYELEVPFGERLKRDNFEKLGEFVRSVVMEVIGEKVLSRKQPLGSTTDLFRYGVDSITAVHIRNRLLKGVEIDSSRISQYVVYEQTSIAGITRYLFAGGDGGTAKEDMEEDLMRHLVRKYDAVDNSWVLGDIMAESETPDEVVLLTGATGSLGRHIAKQIVTERPDINKLYCLCRPESEAKMEALIGELHRIAPSGRRLQISSVVENLDLAGIGKVAYDDLREATIIIHAAWSVNFLAPLSSFESPDISSVQQLLRLARQCKRKACFVFCSSIASHSNQWSIRQSCSDSPSVVDKLGYSRSKWVAEKICENAALAGQTVAIIRIGQLSGDTVDGAWNHSEGWPMMIGSLSEVGCLPDFEQKLSWLPVDLAARGVLDIAGSADRIDTMPGEPVFNLGNMDISTSWSVVLDWLKMAGAQFERVSPQQWLEKIEKLEPGARSRKLFPIWQAMFNQKSLRDPLLMDVSSVVTFSDVLGTGGGWKLHHRYIELMWKNWVKDGLIW